MGAEHRKRMREILRKKEKRAKKEIMIRRIAAPVALVVVILIIVLAVRGCRKASGNGSGSKPTATPVTTATPVPTEVPDIYGNLADEVPEAEHDSDTKEIKGKVLATADPNAVSEDISQEYFKDSVFIGNSMVSSMEIYNILEDTDFFGRVGISISDVETKSADGGSVPIIDELNQGKEYKKIFFMFGENECAWPSAETFKSLYTKAIKKAMRYQPNAQIYLLSITPVSKNASATSANGITKENIEKYNEHIKSVAESAGVGYIDVYTPLVDKDGYLPDSAASDGIHFDKKYYEKMYSIMSSGKQTQSNE